MSLKLVALAGATLALCTLIDPAPVAAQGTTCADLYSRVVALYQTAPLSPAYNQMAAAYVTSCLPRTAAAPVYPQTYVQAPYYPTYDDPASNYGYAEPAYPDYGGYGYGLPIGLGLGFAFAHGFHHDRDHDRDFHHDGNFHHEEFHGGSVHGGSVPGVGVRGGTGHDGLQR
jgi:hypothetical protein